MCCITNNGKSDPEFIWFTNFLRKTKLTHPSGTCPENQEVFLYYYYTVMLLHIPYHNWLIKNSWSYIFICEHQNSPLLRLFFNHRCSFPLTLDSSITHKPTLRCSAQLLLKNILYFVSSCNFNLGQTVPQIKAALQVEVIFEDKYAVCSSLCSFSKV